MVEELLLAAELAPEILPIAKEAAVGLAREAWSMVGGAAEKPFAGKAMDFVLKTGENVSLQLPSRAALETGSVDEVFQQLQRNHQSLVSLTGKLWKDLPLVGYHGTDEAGSMFLEQNRLSKGFVDQSASEAVDTLATLRKSSDPAVVVSDLSRAASGAESFTTKLWRTPAPNPGKLYVLDMSEYQRLTPKLMRAYEGETWLGARFHEGNYHMPFGLGPDSTNVEKYCANFGPSNFAQIVRGSIPRSYYAGFTEPHLPGVQGLLADVAKNQAIVGKTFEILGLIKPAP